MEDDAVGASTSIVLGAFCGIDVRLVWMLVSIVMDLPDSACP